MRRVAVVLLASLLLPGCAPREEPARAELRLRLQQPARLSPDEIERVFAEIGRAVEGRPIRVSDRPAPARLDPAERDAVLGLLADRAGVFDEGLREAGGSRLRVFNGPARSANPEIEASRRLFVDVETLLPRRFEFAHAFPAPDDYSFNLVVE